MSSESSESSATVSTMTRHGDLAEIVNRLRAIGTDSRFIEVKTASGGFPKSIRDTISAFSNSTGGGLVILGLDERTGFELAEGFDANTTAEAAVAMVRPRKLKEQAGPLTPSPAVEVTIVPFEEGRVVLLEVSELEPHQKPCFVTDKGLGNGSFHRLHDGDHRLNEYEVFALQSNLKQPRDDVQAVDGATASDLDSEAVQIFLQKLRTGRAAIFSKLSDQEALVRNGILAADGETPTLGGLLSFGIYPQQYFPQLMITVAEFPGTDKGTVLDGVKLLNRQTVEGNIPLMLEGALVEVVKSLKVRRVVRGSTVDEIPEIPVTVIREAIANALMHRDYSAYTQGEQIRIELYADRLVIENPGGIYGGRNRDDIWNGRSLSRNGTLSRLLPLVRMPGSETTVSENLGTGLQTMLHGMRETGLDAPIIYSTLQQFSVTLPRYGLMTESVRDWIRQIGADRLPIDHQRVLALRDSKESLSVSNVRRLLAIDGEDVRDILESLVVDGWLEYPQHRDQPYADGPRLREIPGVRANSHTPSRVHSGDTETHIRACFETHDELNTQAVVAMTNLHANTVRRHLNRLMDSGWLISVGPSSSPYRTYRKK